MVNKEVLNQHRDLRGGEIVVCAGCGLPIEKSAARLLDKPSPLIDSPEVTWICASCFQALGHDTDTDIGLAIAPEEPQPDRE